MAGIYFHIPFCKSACHYCNFHFSTSLRYKDQLVTAMVRETELQNKFLGSEDIETIYFGGGTPSLLPPEDLAILLEKTKSLFRVSPVSEITLEANPDDISESMLKSWHHSGINRLSIGVQSFFDSDLQWMNRAHTAKQATGTLQQALQYFENISIDLIYGVPGLTNERWKQNADNAIAWKIPHLSCYALTPEPKTPLAKLIHRQKKQPVDTDIQANQMRMLMNWMEKAGYEQYEISNFAKPGFRSLHNSSYWSGKKYLGIGPSAHSFNGTLRQWNMSNNMKYIRQIESGIVPCETEEITDTQRLNEYIMTALRTADGIDLKKMDTQQSAILLQHCRRYLSAGWLVHTEDAVQLTNEGKLFADGISAGLFF